ncbi:MAG TPA: substrate-binding domain-containing protein [bacterium]|nr:substrate-binding domain-containing protein [bacterium]
MNRKTVLAAMVCLFMAFALHAAAKGKRVLKMATTTSTQSSGLLDYLLPVFEKEYGIEVQVIAVGTGKALKLAENGDVDVVMVHAPEAEMKFVDAGFGVNRRPFMKNDFVIVGPPSDPAGIKSAASLKDALGLLTDNKNAVFISRGDDSGTNKKELQLWPLVNGKPAADRYLEIGQGMEEALRMAHEKKAYTLSDRGTYLALKKTLDLDIVCENDPALDNPYAMIATNPARYPDANYMDAMLLIAWLTSPEGQARIGSFQAEGQVLFHPAAIPAMEK